MNSYKCLVAGLAFVSFHAGAQDVTTLICQGSGTNLEYISSQSMEYDEKAGDYSKSTNTSTTRHRSFNGSITAELAGNAVRLKLPNQLVPGWNRGQDGWFTLSDPFIGDKEITGTLVLNPLNKPKINIDRVTGQISLAHGDQSFTGNCSKVDTASGPKF